MLEAVFAHIRRKYTISTFLMTIRIECSTIPTAMVIVFKDAYCETESGLREEV